MKALLILNFIIPFVMLLVGGILKNHPQPYPGPSGSAKWKLGSSGYNTPGARKSKARWDYAQQIAPNLFIKRGKHAALAAVLFAVVGLFTDYLVGLIPAYAAGFVLMIWAFIETEKALKDRFGL